MILETHKRVPASGPRNAKIAFVGMAPAADEVAKGKPFVGAAGGRLNAAIGALGHSRDECFVTNVLEFPIQVGDSIFQVPPAILNQEVQRLKAELEMVRPNIAVALGAEPMQILCGHKSILNWRGSILNSSLVPGLKTMPTVHPAWIMRGMWKWDAVFRYIDLKRAFEQSEFPEIKLPPRDALTGPSFRTVMDWLRYGHTQPYMAFDYETAYWGKAGMGEIACVSIAYSPNQALTIPFFYVGTAKPCWTDSEEAAIWRAFAALLQDKNVKKICQNAPFEWLYSWRQKVYPWPLFIDTLTLHHALYPDFGGAQGLVYTDSGSLRKKFEEPGHGLAFINSQYTLTPYYKDDGHNWHPALGEHQFWRYCAYDSMVTFEAGMKMMAEAIEDNMWDFYQDFYVKPFPHSVKMEWAGVAIDLERRIEAGKQIDARIEELQAQINSLLGWKLNVNSPKQMQHLLYGERKYKPQYKMDKKSGSRRLTTDKYALTALARENSDPILEWVMELRRIKDLKADLIDKPLGEDKRMHTHYNIGGADSGRWSSTTSIMGTGTNLQNIPRKGVGRKLFIPVPSFVAV